MNVEHDIGRRGVLALTAGAAAAPFAIAGLGTSSAMAQTTEQGSARPVFYRFMFGEFEVTTLLDGFNQGEGPHPTFGMNQPAEAVQELARLNFLPPDRMENSYTPVLVKAGQELVLFDTGNVPGRRPTSGNLLQSMQAAGYSPEQVTVVVITHMHGDHIGGLMLNGQPAFPNARYVTGQVEYDFWSADDRLDGPTADGAKLVRSNVVPLAEKTTFLGDDGEVVTGIRSIAAFGHSPGHMAYHLESGSERLLLWADTANHYVMSVQRPEWHVRFDMDKDDAIATRKRLLDMAEADRIPVTGYHMPFPALGYIDRHPDRYLWVPVTYQLNL